MSNIEYEYIKAILENQSITEASKKLYISQSALSQYIKRIEEKIGVNIFDRDFSPIRLTEAGEIYFTSLIEIATIEEDAINQIHELTNLKKGKVIVGSTDYISYYILSKVIKDFNNKYPGIDIILYEAKTDELDQAALDGECDFSITYDVSNVNGLTNISLYQEEIFVAISKDNKLVKKLSLKYPQNGEFPTIDASYLKNSNIVRMKKGQYLRNIFSELDLYTDNTLKTVLETENLYLAIKFANDDIGISIVPAFMAKSNNLSCIFIRTNPIFSKRTIMIHYNSNRKLKKSAQILISMLKDYVRDNL